MNKKDTIAAISTPLGQGGIGIIRISGSLVKLIFKIILRKTIKPRYAEYLNFFDKNGNILDKGISIFFPNPNSFTGEDVLEFHCHGGPIILDMLLEQIISINGVRIANPGEFSERAFFNNKIDLVQAEAIADLISAKSRKAVHSATKSLQGKFSSKIHKLIKSITKLRIYIEASIDFVDETNYFFSNKKFNKKIESLITAFNKILYKANNGNILKEGIKVVIAGKPNVGKSSILNALIEQDSSIVTAIAGTTRDVLYKDIYLNNIQISLIDTAGLRISNDEVEILGIKKAWKEIKQADHILMIIDHNDINPYKEKFFCDPFFKDFPLNIPITIVRNKADILKEKININKVKDYVIITISVKLNQGIDLLRNYLKKKLTIYSDTENVFLARRRHISALNSAQTNLKNIKKNFFNDINSNELIAEELKLAQRALETIIGTYKSKDLLKSIFSNFCIGK